MALFETMRENTKIILWVTVVAFVGLIFLAWGADFSTKPRRGDIQSGVLVRVNDQKIMMTEYHNAFMQAWTTYEQQTGKHPDDAIELMLQASTWENLVDRTLIQQEVRRRKIRVADREVAIALVSSPPQRFLTNPMFLNEEGRFDIERWRGWVADPRTNTFPLEAELREMVAHEKMKMLLLSGVKVSDAEVREAWLMQNDKIDLAYAMISYHKMHPESEVDDAALEAYLHGHADDFRHLERAALEYIRLDKQVTAEDSAEARDEINEAYQEHRRGEDFGILVQAYSEAAPSRSGGETASFLSRVQISQSEVAEAAFSLPVGEISEIIASSDGFHMIKVEARETKNGTEKVRLAEIFIPLRMSTESNMMFRERTLDLADSARVLGFLAAAATQELNVHKTGLFNPTGFIPGLSRVRAAKEFAARADVGEISKPIETADTWYLLHLSERLPSGPAALEEVRPRVEAALLLERRKAAARERAEAILARCQGSASLEEAAKAETLAVFSKSEGVTPLGFIRGIGSDPMVTGTAFAAGDGVVPFVVMGNQGVFVLQRLSHSEIDEEAFAEVKQELRMQLLREKQNRALITWMEDIREQADIEDYRLSIASL